MPNLDRLKLDLKRVNKRKADLERQIAELEFDEMKSKVESLGLSLDKIYRVDEQWTNWYKISDEHFNGETFLTHFHYRIENVDEQGVNLAQITGDDYGGFHIYSPFEYLIEVDENE